MSGAARDRLTACQRWGWLLPCVTALALGCGSRTEHQALQILDARALQTRGAAERGHPVLVAFWATWCQPCVEEFPDLVALHRESPAGLQVLAVSLDIFLSGEQTPRVVAEHLKIHPTPVDHVIYSGTQDALFTAFDMPGNIPYAILYGADGSLLQRFPGRATPAEVRAALRRAAVPGA